MIIVLGLSFLFSVCVLFHFLLRKKSWYEQGGFVLAALFLLLLVFALIILPFARMGCQAQIKEFESVKITLELARAADLTSPYELAAIQQKVVESNKWLASAKYWAKNPLMNWYWVKGVLDLQPIR